MITTKTKTDFLPNKQLFLEILFLYIFAMTIPRITYALMIIRGVFLIIKLCSSILLGLHNSLKIFLYKNFVYALVTITIFCFLFFLTSYSYEIIREEDLLLGITLPYLSYLVGYSINLSKLPGKPFHFIYTAMALIGGSITFVYLSVINNPLAEANAGIDIASRSLPSVWADNLINGPVLDLNILLGFSLLPLIINIKTSKLNIINCCLISLISFIFLSMALYSCLALQGRKPLLYLCFILLVILFLNFSKNKNVHKKLSLIIGATFVVIIIFTFQESIFSYLTENYGGFKRLESDGLDTPRYIVWLEILQGIPDILLGGKSFKISESFAHNLWLDILYDAGLLPFILICIFHWLHVKAVINICFSHLPDIIIYFVISIVIALIFGWLVEPVVQSSIYYFSMTCSLLGLIMRLSEIADNSTKLTTQT